MQWESRLLDVLDDLEQQAAGLYLAERDEEVGELLAGEYATVSLAARCRAAVGHELALVLLGGLRVRARLVRAGAEWLVLREPHAGWLVPLDAVAGVAGLPRGSAHESTWSLADRLPLRALLRRVAEEDPDCRVHLRDGACREATLRRVGADFVELRPAAGAATGAATAGEVVATGALAALRWRAP